MMLKNPSLDLPGALGVLTLDSPRTEKVSTLVHQVAACLGKAIDAKDSHTLAHSEEVAIIAQTLALTMGLDSPLADRVHVAGHLHDIGKIGVPDAILGKPGPLTPQEWIPMRAHPDLGATILTPLACLRETGIVDMVRAHHERFDGTGYPCGLAGRAIPLGARIIAVADCLSAMLQARPYRPAMDFETVRKEIIRCSGTQFDPDIVAAFVACDRQLQDMIACARYTERD